MILIQIHPCIYYISVKNDTDTSVHLLHISEKDSDDRRERKAKKAFVKREIIYQNCKWFYSIEG